jgi:nitroreductase
MTTIATLLTQRVSANAYDSSKTLSNEKINQIIELAAKAPSAFNLQNWKVIAVTSADGKKRLCEKAYGQQKVIDASATFIICGTLDQPNTVTAALKPTLDAGIIDQATFDGWVGAVTGMYTDNAVMQRDEAVRSGSLLAMSLMLVAQGEGLVSCPMIGFDPTGVSAEFGLSASEIPVMLVTVGYASEGNWPQKPRKSVKEILTFA